MIIAAITPTFNRPRQLGNLIACFEAQTHEFRRLLVLDDANQIPELTGDRWMVVSVADRYRTLGDKRNAATAMALERWPEIDAIAPWDDDDIYLDHHLEACVASLQDHQWGQPGQVLINAGDHFKRMRNYRDEFPYDVGYHGGWCFRREAFERIGGYASINNGEDSEIASRAFPILGPSGNTVQYPWPGQDPTPLSLPTYCYNSHGTHLSSMGPDGYEKLGRQKIDPVTELDISWPEDYLKWPIDDEVLPRNW